MNYCVGLMSNSHVFILGRGVRQHRIASWRDRPNRRLWRKKDIGYGPDRVHRALEYGSISCTPWAWRKWGTCSQLSSYPRQCRAALSYSIPPAVPLHTWSIERALLTLLHFSFGISFSPISSQQPTATSLNLTQIPRVDSFPPPSDDFCLCVAK